jgi:hypothetical protein
MSTSQPTIKITNHKNGSKTISGLSDADMNMLAEFLEWGAQAMPKHAETTWRCDAVWRFAQALRTTVIFPGSIGSVEMVAGSDTATLYEDVTNVWAAS